MSQKFSPPISPLSDSHDGSVLIYKAYQPDQLKALIGMEVLPSPVSFLARAMSGNCSQLIVFIEWATRKEREALVELCAALRHNRITAKVPLICIMQDRHRELLSQLEAAGVKWVAFIKPDNRALLSFLADSKNSTGNSRRLNTVLRELCPYLNYAPVKTDKEMCVCGAYRNRMVLGRDRRNQFCENGGFALCQFFRDFQAFEGHSR